MIESPNITAEGDDAIVAIKSYLFRLSEQLNHSLQTVNTQIEQTEQAISESQKEKTEEDEAQDAIKKFNLIKANIIKTADFVEAFGNVLEKKLNGVYVAKSGFDEYKEATEQTIQATSNFIQQNFIREATEVSGQTVYTLTTGAAIRTGYLGDEGNVPIYGIELGQQTVLDGKEVFNGFARFTANRLSFYNNQHEELAYFSNNELHITKAIIDREIKLGGYVINYSSTYGTTFNWRG